MCAAAIAQDITAPLGVIDWINDQAALQAARPRVAEPGVTGAADVPVVTVSPLDGTAPKRVGLVPSSVTGLPDTLWSVSDANLLAVRIAGLPALRLPALQQLTYVLLLAEAAPPHGEAAAFDLARVDALMSFGALDPGLALIEQAGPATSPQHFARFMDLSLLAGTESSACAALLESPQLSPGTAHEVFCHARAGDWNTAVLLLGIARTLDLLPEVQGAALERFLDPDLFEDEPPLPIPAAADPLSFRLYQAIGTPMPTRMWPLIYANTDLSYTSGWKAQIEAAERLSQRGTLPDNRLLGLYTRRQPAASGGVWDRVAALQRFETALETGSPAAVSKTLPTVWREMQKARLSVPFANLFSEQLSTLALTGHAADIAFEVLLLSPDYNSAARTYPARASRNPVLAAIANGDVPGTVDAEKTAAAILSGFSDAAPDQNLIAASESGELGRVLLETIAMAHAAGEGDIAQLSTAIATLRTLGFEDVARRTALQILLMGAQE